MCYASDNALDWKWFICGLSIAVVDCYIVDIMTWMEIDACQSRGGGGKLRGWVCGRGVIMIPYVTCLSV